MLMLPRSPYYPITLYPGTTPSPLLLLPFLPFLPFRSAKLRIVPTFLHFGLLFTKICVYINMMAFSPGEGGGKWRLSLAPFPLPPPPSPVPYPGYCTRLTCPLLPTDNLNNRKPIQKPRSMPTPTICLPLPRLSTRRSFPAY